MSYLSEIWRAWRGLFVDLPYGDPYLAAGLLIVLFAVTVFMALARVDA